MLYNPPGVEGVRLRSNPGRPVKRVESCQARETMLLLCGSPESRPLLPPIFTQPYCGPDWKPYVKTPPSFISLIFRAATPATKPYLPFELKGMKLTMTF